MEVLSNFQYKKLFLPNITEKILANNTDIQLYRLENYLKGILMPVIPYRTAFNFIIFVTNGHIKQYLENEEYHAEKEPLFSLSREQLLRLWNFRMILKGFF